VLVGRIYNCVCGSGGEHPATPDDVENAARWARSDGLHRSRALERVAPGDDPDRPFAEEALSFYLPRAVYAIGTIVNRLDNSPRIDHSSPGIYPRGTSDERRRCMSALLLYAADCANALWPHLTERPRPRQLTFSPVYRENNVWMALEAGVKVWASTESPIPLTLWPDEPDESGGLCVFEGPLRDLVSDLMGKPRFDAKQPSTSRGQGVSIKAVVTAIPRPNQAFWTLSALWSGWLWGRTAVGPFKSVLRRRRYDWQWHAEALKALFGNLVEILPPDVPFLGILAEPEASFISAVYLAAQAAGLETISQQDRYGRSITESGESRLRRDGGSRNELEPVQILWKKVPAVTSVNGGLSRGVKKKPLSLDVNYTCKVIRETLEKNNEPMAYLHIHTAVLTALAKKGMLQWSDDALSMLGKNIHAALASPEFVDLEDRSIPEKGKWALKKWGEQGLLQGM
jgi:hypothetical protein